MEWVLIFGFVLVLLAYILIFNSMVAAHHKVKQAWSGIDVQLKRRHDLIPKLVDTVKAYTGYEKDVLKQVVAARSEALGVPAGEMHALEKAETGVSGALQKIFALAEAYPELKANQSYLHLQQEITETEDQIAAARRIYNANVNELNIKVNSFPQNLVAKIHKYGEADLFEFGEGPAQG